MNSWEDSDSWQEKKKIIWELYVYLCVCIYGNNIQKKEKM